MLRDSVITLAKARCKRAGTTVYDASLVTEMQHIQATILEAGPVYPWFMQTATNPATFRVAADVQSIALPSDFIIEDEEGIVRIWETADYDAGDLSDPFEIVKDDPQQVLLYHKENSGDVEAYFVRGSTMYFRPIPDTAISIEFPYYARLATLSSNIENAWLTFGLDVMLTELCKVFSGKYLRDAEAASGFASDATAAWEKLWRLDEARRQKNVSHVMSYGSGST